MATIPDDQKVTTTNAVMQRLFRMLLDYESSNGSNFFGNLNPTFDMQDVDERIIAVITAETDGVYDCGEVGKTDGSTALGGFAQSRIFNDSTIQVVEANGATGIPIGTPVELFLRFSPDGEAQWYFIAGGAVSLDNCTLLVEEGGDPQTRDEQDAIAPGCLDTSDAAFSPTSGNYTTRRVKSIDAASGEAKVPVTLDDEGCVIEVGPVDLSQGGEDYDPLHAVKGDKKWIKVANINNDGVNTAVVSHINKATTVVTTIDLTTATSLGLDKYRHVIEVDGSPVDDYDEDPVDITDCGPYPIFVDDDTIETVDGVVIVGFFYDTGTTDVVTEVCPFEIYDVLFHLEKPVSTPFTTYDDSIGVIQAYVIGTNDLCRWTDGDDLRTAIDDLDGTNHGIEFSPELLLPPSAFESGSTQIKVTYNVPIVGLCTSKTLDICDLESNLGVKEGDDSDISEGDPANYDFYLDVSGAGYGVNADYDGRYRIDCIWTYGASSTFLAEQIITTWETVTVGAVDFSGGNIVLLGSIIEDKVSVGEEICLTVKVYDLEFNAYVDAWEQTLCRDYVALVCWSDDFTEGSLNSRWDTTVNTATSVVFSGTEIEVTVATSEVYEIYQTNHNLSDGTSWRIEATFTDIVLTGSSDTFDFGIRGKIGSDFYQAMLHQSAINSRGFYALKNSTFTSLAADSSNTHATITLSVEYNGTDTITCSDGTNTKTYAATGDMTNVRMAVSQNPTGDTISGNFSDFKFESPIGTPYCT